MTQMIPDGWNEGRSMTPAHDQEQLSVEALERKINELEALNTPGAIDAPPSHYAGNGIQVFDIIDAFELNFYEGNALKYLLRHKKKHGMNDLLKARHYLDEVIARVAKP